ncbi:uncharacterized protein G2W53_007754 [Senna tora]|uniref:Uncharacterized protein n=1 Tax=Senna tora TaxID=362788 RepID=A0A834X6U3_9FABA|nr:uncharacterized protein G2W53_007754 [Senna tora]
MNNHSLCVCTVPWTQGEKPRHKALSSSRYADLASTVPQNSRRVSGGRKRRETAQNGGLSVGQCETQNGTVEGCFDQAATKCGVIRTLFGASNFKLRRISSNLVNLTRIEFMLI